MNSTSQDLQRYVRVTATEAGNGGCQARRRYGLKPDSGTAADSARASMITRNFGWI